MMKYFEKSLGDTVKRKGDRFIIQCKCEPFLVRYETERGLILYRGDDRYGWQLDLQESSGASEPCIWLGRREKRSHLDQSQVAALIPLLEHFVETGRLP